MFTVSIPNKVLVFLVISLWLAFVFLQKLYPVSHFAWLIEKHENDYPSIKGYVTKHQNETVQQTVWLNYTGAASLANHSTWVSNETVSQQYFYQYEHFLQTDTGRQVKDIVSRPNSTVWAPIVKPKLRKLLARFNRNVPSLYANNYTINEMRHAYIMIDELMQRSMKGGSSFYVVQHFGPNFQSITMCSVVDHFNGSYSVNCPGYKMECIKVLIYLQFDHFSAFHDLIKKRVKKNSLLLYNKTTCPDENFIADPIPILWMTNEKGKCQMLRLQGRSIIPPSLPEICECVKYFDDIYILGVSHIRYIALFLSVRCIGLNKTVEKGHDWSHGNIHYLSWRYMKDLPARAMDTVPQWFNRKANSTIAIWIQFGAWGMSRSGLAFTYNKHINFYREGLENILKLISKSNINVDLRILGPAAASDQVMMNNFAVGAANTKLRHMLEEMKIHFTDLFELEVPCKNDTAEIVNNHNHYFQRIPSTNEFVGDVGSMSYLGVFLSGVCHGTQS